MTGALTPDLAIAYVRELSADVRAAVVLDPAGERVAGDTRLAPAARAAAAALRGAAAVAASTHLDDRGIVTVVVTADHTLLVISGPLAFEGPTLIDARAAAAAMTQMAPETIAAAPPETLKSAVEREISEFSRQTT
ncbi:MAG: hypothetical protein QOF76_5638 [Solirubrobacteraceae bacterium]|jgi:hypothetical protein|nr:hypothetical protein [Solirubrobacteraceae bacterium]